MENTEVLSRQDRGFAARLARRDASVLADIDAAYSASLRRLLRSYRDPQITDDDIDEIVADALNTIWQDYRNDGGASVRTFYFIVGKRRRIDALRSHKRRRVPTSLPPPGTPDEPVSAAAGPDAACIEAEADQRRARIMSLVDEAVSRLTSRQRQALKRRFAPQAGRQWAKNLEDETRIPAKQWRKASAEALDHVRSYLERKGVVGLKEGGCDEITRTRTSA